jgi:thymidylate synthase ThyX
MNFRSWRHFIKVRALDPHSQWEIRELANRILDELYKVAPNVFQDLIDERERQKQT